MSWWLAVLLKYYSVLLQYYLVIQSTTPVLTCTTKYYKVLLQYYSVLQSTTPILPCTTKYYSSTTLYLKVLLQYYSVLQSTTPILLRTTNTTLYYSSTTLYYKVPLKYYSSTTKYFMIDPHHIWNVIYNARSNRHQPPTSPNTAPTTQNESHDWSASHMKRHLQCAKLRASPSNLTKYCACHAKWSVMIDPHHRWNVIYNALSNRPHPPTSAIMRLPRQMECHDWSASQMQRHLQCA